MVKLWFIESESGENIFVHRGLYSSFAGLQTDQQVVLKLNKEIKD